MGRLLRIAIGWGLLPALLAAQSPSKTFFEERLLDRAPVIVRARFAADQSCFDVDVGAFNVTRRLRGEADNRILVLGAAQLATKGRDFDSLLFLRPEPSGCLYRIIDTIDLPDEADATEAFVRAFLAVAKEDEPMKRRAGLKQLIHDGFAMRSEFPRKLAARELERLARRTPPVLTVEELADFAKLLPLMYPDDAARVGPAIDAAEDAALKQFAGTQTAFPRGPKRTQYVRLVGEFVSSSDPDRQAAVIDRIALKFGDAAVPFLMKLLDDAGRRGRVLVHLGAMQWTPAVPQLIVKIAPGAPDPGPVIACLGEIGVEAAVAPVSRYLSTGDHFEAAALALARIQATSSERILDSLLLQLRRDPRQQPRVEFLERIRSKEFLEDDTDRRRAAKGRYPRE